MRAAAGGTFFGNLTSINGASSEQDTIPALGSVETSVCLMCSQALKISTIEPHPTRDGVDLAWNSTHSESPDSEAPKGFIRLNNLAPIVTSYSVSKPQFTCVSSSVLSMHNLTD